MPTTVQSTGQVINLPIHHARNRHVRCGDCNQPAYRHPFVHPEWPSLSCDRGPETIGNRSFDYEDEGHRTYVDYYPEGDPVVDYSGMGVATSEDYDRWDTVPDPTAEADLAGDYRDLATSEQTVTLEQYRAGITTGLPSNVEPRSRNAYVEGQDGFSTETVWNEGLTRKYHARLLNVFRAQTGHLRIGSIEIGYLPDGAIRAKCVKCKQQLTCTLPAETSSEFRTTMEDFVLSVIRHGNNHAAAWFRNRPTFYKVHASDCSLTCDPASAHCVPVSLTTP